MQTKAEFVARNADAVQVARKIGADLVIYQPLSSLKKAVQMENPRIKAFCAACFDGKYPTGDVTPDVLRKIEAERKIIQDSQLELNLRS